MDGNFITLASGTAVPAGGIGLALLHPCPHVVTTGEVALCLGVVLLRRLAEEFSRLIHVSGNGDTPRIVASERALGIRLPLSCRLAVPLNGLAGTLGHARTAFVTIPQIVLGQCKSLVCRLAEPLDRLRGVGGNAITIAQAVAVAVLCFSMPLLGSLAVPVGGLGNILPHTAPLIIAVGEVELRLCLTVRGRTVHHTVAGCHGKYQQEQRAMRHKTVKGESLHAASQSLAAFLHHGNIFLVRPGGGGLGQV